MSGVHLEDTACAGGDLTPTDPNTYWAGLKVGARSWCPGGTPNCDQIGAGHGQFRGDIDEAMLYSEALDVAQIHNFPGLARVHIPRQKKSPPQGTA